MDISPAAPLEARFQLDQADVKAFRALAGRETSLLSPKRLLLILLAVFLLVLVASILFHRMRAGQGIASPAVVNVGAGGKVNLDNVFALFIPIGLVMMIGALAVRKIFDHQSKNPMLAEPTQVTLDNSAMTRQCGAFFNRIEWHGIARVITSQTHLILMTSSIEGFIVPRRAFDSDGDWQRFTDFALANWQKTRPVVPPIADV